MKVLNKTWRKNIQNGSRLPWLPSNKTQKVEKVLSRRPKNLEIGLISEHTFFTTELR